MSSVVDKIMELEQQKQKLLDDARKELVATAEKAVADLNNLGFNYRLVEGAAPTATRSTSSGGRRTGIAETVLGVVKNAPEGIARAGVLEAMDAEDNKAKQSVSNALANLKKKGLITLSDTGLYKAA